MDFLDTGQRYEVTHVSLLYFLNSLHAKATFFLCQRAILIFLSLSSFGALIYAEYRFVILAVALKNLCQSRC